MRSAVGVRACFANVFATKLVINRQEGRTGTKREGGAPNARAVREQGRSRDPAFEVLASEFARTRLGYREEKRFDTGP